MYDYWKLRVYDREQIQTITLLSFLNFKGTHSRNTGEAFKYPITTKWKNFYISVFSDHNLEIRGSIHKYWNGGTNENDFKHSDARHAINNFCRELSLCPSLAEVVNLEYAVNIRPTQDASDLLDQIICIGNALPKQPYERRPDLYFTEYKSGENYVKVYDKGKWLKSANSAAWNGAKNKNIFRFEIKAKKNRVLDFAGVRTLADLLSPAVPHLLAGKIDKVFESVVFNDNTIDPNLMSKPDYKVYMQMKDPNERRKVKGNKTSSDRAREKRFAAVVKKYGKQNLHETIKLVIREKLAELCDTDFVENPS